MPDDVFHQLYYHVVWATKHRLPSITEALQPTVVAEVESACRRHGGVPTACYAMPDHVHLALAASADVALATLIGRIKGASSHNVRAGLRDDHAFGWQDGYGAVTFRKEELAKIVRHISDQETLHRDRRISRLLERCRSDGP